MPEINIENMSKDEMLKVLSDNGINFKELAAGAAIAKELKEENRTTSKIATKEPEYSLVLHDSTDFVIRKQTGNKTYKLLVVMPSQGTAYFKDQSGEITQLTPEKLKGFMRNMPKIDINSWIDYLNGGADEANALLRVINDPIIMEMHKQNIGPAFDHRPKEDSGYYYSYNDKSVTYKKYKLAYELSPLLLKSYKGNRKVLDKIAMSPRFFSSLVDTFGIQNARDFIDEMDVSLAEIEAMDTSRYVYNRDQENKKSSMPNVNMDYKTFKEYVLYDSVYMGFGDSIFNFMETWNDTLRMQKTLYKKIKEKYPSDLLLLHNQLSYKVKKYSEKIEEIGFAENVLLAKEYEATVGDYVFIAPTCKQDFLDEATAQSNCLASYVKRFAMKEDIIMFMRAKQTPELSLVTIEIKDGEVVQKYQSRNRACTPEQNDVIERWIKKINKKTEEK